MVSLAALFAVLVAGCGTGAYDELLDKRAVELRHGAKFLDLCAPITLEKTRFTIELPNLFKPIQTQPTPFIPFRGFVPFQGDEVYEEGVKAPYYFFYLAVRSNPNLAADLAAKVKAVLPDSAAAWETIAVDTPTPGEKLEWQVMRMEGEMPFDVQVKDATEVRRLPAKAEVWLHAGPKASLILLWQIPTKLEEKVELLEFAPITAGTLKTLPAPPAADPAGGDPAGAPPA